MTVVHHVAQYDDRLVGMADDDVGAAVVVQVAEGNAATDTLHLKEGAAVGRYFLKANHTRGARVGAPQIAKQRRPLLVFARRRGVVRDVAVGDEDILGAVAVEVEEAGAEADIVESNRGDAGGAAAEMKLPAPQVFVQRVRLVLKVAHEQRKA